MNGTRIREQEDVVAGTVGDDVMTVHELLQVGETLRPKCGAGKSKDQAVQWLRVVNCPACLAGEE
ncbi:hypothetical protein [Streptomyces natalensis]|uniref:Uncharacterized protein n=1 Tax=Streptomyces natalensis ATCC 27448 TaxID=1240678 RepID=A0A0D7CN81_9ACTN|nr:hypothetical protein [Streptomyces natalensis]KIZ17305.1 hypothetical protein SNA_14865 [Streptomyces natalensis ATCC 27448]